MRLPFTRRPGRRVRGRDGLTLGRLLRDATVAALAMAFPYWSIQGSGYQTVYYGPIEPPHGSAGRCAHGLPVRWDGMGASRSSMRKRSPFTTPTTPSRRQTA